MRSAALALLLLAGCAAPSAKRAPAAAPAPRAAVSPQQRAEADREFYRAVSAYMRGDYDEARDRVNEILREDPNDEQALRLGRRIKAAERAQR